MVAGVIVVAAFFGLRTFPNYDTYYQFLWGQQLSNGQLPDYAVFRSPTPHPLAELVGLALAPFGLAADRIWVLLTLILWVGLALEFESHDTPEYRAAIERLRPRPA